MNFLEAQKKAKNLTPQRISNDLFRFIRTIENELAELNRIQLNERSKDVEENPIGFYSAATEYITLNNALLGKGNKIKKEGDPFDLDDTGKFLPSIFAKVQNDSIFFDATDEKKLDVLENLLSKDIFGLSDKDLQRAIDEHIKPFFLDYFRKELT